MLLVLGVFTMDQQPTKKVYKLPSFTRILERREERERERETERENTVYNI